VSKHTPGPWKVDEEFYMYVMKDNLVVADCYCCGQNGHLPEEEQKANAQLIAAAPELLGALKRVKRFIKNGRELGYITVPDEPDTGCKTIKLINQAIAKAEGDAE